MNDADRKTVCLGLGANLGDREANIREALRRIDLLPRSGLAGISRIYETEPWGGLSQPDYLNCAAVMFSELQPLALLRELAGIEREIGRFPAPHNHPRPIDIDLLMCGNLVIDSDEITLPHPRMLERRFVLLPLSEIAPDTVHPVAGETIARLLELCSDICGVRPFAKR